MTELGYTLPDSMLCPICQTAISGPTVGTLTICPNTECLRTLVIDGDHIELAASADTLNLSDVQLAKLRAERKAKRNA